MSAVIGTTTPRVEMPLIFDIEATAPTRESGRLMPQSVRDAPAALRIAIIDDRPLLRDCFGRGLMAVDPDLSIRYFRDVAAFEETGANGTDVALLCLDWSSAGPDEHCAAIARLQEAGVAGQVILLADLDRFEDVQKVMECGARGYIPMNVSLEVALKAMQLVAAGGVYVPASVLFWPDRAARPSQAQPKPTPLESIFTSRQMSVIEALRRGKANKIIAYELSMCESTVKVHIRNIMKRLKAKNRTEVAYILNNMIKDNTPVVRG